MRALLIDDHGLFRKGVIFLLSELDESLECVEANSCEQALELAGQDEVNLVLLDFHLPGEEGLSALKAIKSAFESATIVMLSGEDDPQAIRASVDQGASGFIPKSSTPEVLVAALRLILAGGTYLPPNAFHEVPQRSAPDKRKPSTNIEASNSVDGLSQRQLEVLLRVVQGKPNKVVARELEISEGTVKAHLSAAFRVLGVSNRTEAVFRAAQLGLTPGANRDSPRSDDGC